MWAGFALVLAGIASYPVFFIRFPVTRNFPWANLILFLLAALLLITWLRRAFQKPEAYRGKLSGTILASLSALLIVFFLFAILYMAGQVPESRGAPLADQNGHLVTLSTMLNSSFSTNDWPAAGDAHEKTAGAVLIFYRGYW